MNTPCTHCHADIEIDPATLAALAGKNHFACPACQGAVAVPARPQMPATAHRGLNRNLLILGGVALLVLGGLGIFLASQKSGDTNTTVQNIRSEIINNSYFTQLIADGITTKADLEAIPDIRPYGNGFIGISATSLEWKEANALAVRTGAVVLEAASDDELHPWLTKIYDLRPNFAAWVLARGDVGLLTSAGPVALKNADGTHKVLLNWNPAKTSFTNSEPESADGKAIISGWRKINGKWADEEGVMTGVGDIDAFLLLEIEGEDFDYEADITLKTDMPSAGSLVFRSSDQVYEQCYVVNISSEMGGIVKLFSLPYQTLAIHKTPVKPNETYHLRVSAEGKRIRVYFNHSPDPVIDFNDANISKGNFGLLSWQGTSNFKNVEIKMIESKPDDDNEPEAFGGRKISEVVDLESAAVLVNDEFDDPDASGFSWAGKERYKDGRIIFNGMEGPCWGYSGLDFNDLACEVVARTSQGEHNGWGICVFKTWGGKPPKEHVHGVEILLNSIGELSVIPCRWISEHQEDIDAREPIPVASFKKNESNSLMVTFSETRKLSVFVNGVEACPPLVLPYVLEPAGLQMASVGGTDVATLLEFESFKVFSLINKKPGKPSWTVTGEQSLIGLIPTKAEVGFWQLLAGEHPENRLVAIKGKPKTDYLLAHAPSRVEYDIPAGAAMFKALGLSTSIQNCTFSVAVDGKEMFTSGTLERYDDGVVDINVMLPEDAKKLAIITTNVGDFNGCQTCWVEPRFVKGEQGTNGGGVIPDTATPATSEPGQSAPDPKVDAWIDTNGSEIQARFIRLEGEVLFVDFKDKETPIPLSRLSPGSKDLALKRQAESNP